MQASILIMVWLFSMFSLPASAGFDEGLTAYKNNDFETARSEWQPLAAQEDADAQYNLGVMYLKGQGVKQNFQEALVLFRSASERGDASAQFNLGLMYHAGDGVQKDNRQAVAWFRKAARNGHAGAQYNLGVLNDAGLGVLQDYSKAAFWYRKAAEQGYAKAQTNLGVLHESGHGVPKSRVLAYALYDLSAENDPSENNVAAKNRSSLAGQLTTREQETARELVGQMAMPGNLIRTLDSYIKQLMARKKPG